MEAATKIQFRNAMTKLEGMTEEQFLADCRSMKIKGVPSNCEKCLVAQWFLGKFSDESARIEVAPPFATIFVSRMDRHTITLPEWVQDLIGEFDEATDLHAPVGFEKKFAGLFA